MEFLTEFNGKFFVWTKKGRAPRFAHDTKESAIAEASRLAAINPGRKFIVQQFLEKVSVAQPVPIVGAEKGTAMKKIWYGAKDDTVRFSEDPSVLSSQHGISDAKSFTVTGDVTGLNLIAATQQVGSQQGQQTS